VWELLGGNRSLSNAVKKTKADALENLNPEELNALVNDLRIEAEWVKASFGFPDSIERVRIAVRDGLLESWSDLEHAIPYAHQKGDPGILLIVGGRPSDETKLSQEARRELSEILASVDLSRFEDFLNPTTRQNLAGLLAIAGLNPEAEFAYRRAIELDPEDNWNRIFLADFLANRIGNADAAESVLREARKGNITTPWVFLDLAKLLEKLGRPTEEIEGALQSAIQADPTYSWSWFKFGNFLGGLDGREGEAEQAIRKAIELEPDEAFYWVELCRILDTKMGRLEEALSALRKASALAPGKAYIWHVLGSLLFNRIGDFQEAEKAYRKALELDPRSISTWIQLGDLLRDFLKQPEEAESSYRKALELQPQHTFALANLAYLLLDVSERSDDAEIAFSEAQAAILPKGAALLRAYRAFGRDNFGEACQALLEALGSESLDLLTTFRDDLLRVLRKARESGYGEKLLAWFDGSGMGDRYWPVRAAFDAYLHGEEKLRDVNPEVRGVAAQLLASLNRISIPRASEGSAPGTGRRRGKGIATPRLKTSGEAPTISPRLRKAPKSPTRSGK
jgi:tetratricopeptide (TPR) repeat protein